LKILLTGAGGFTGKRFSMIALDKGHEVFPLRSNLLDEEGMRRELNELKPDFVVHLAAVSFVDHFDQTELYRVNTIGTKNLLDVLSKLSFSLSKVLLVSTANLYGNSSSEYISEEAVLRPTNHYSVSKLG
jgi:nucleoside-diphosphate-sugar epimerase